MLTRSLGIMAILLILLGGCATGRLPGSSGDVEGPLASIDLHVRQPARGDDLYPTGSRDRFYASDRNLHVVLHWLLLGPGDYTSVVTLKTPAGIIHQERKSQFHAKQPSWLTMQRLELPHGEAAKSLAGQWQVEVVLDGVPVGRRAFTFDPGSIRLASDARVLIVPVKSGQQVVWGDWAWRDTFGALEHEKMSSTMLGIALQDELGRRFPNVDAPREKPEITKGMIMVVPRLDISPDINIAAKLDVEIFASSSTPLRKFAFQTTAGYERGAGGGLVHFGVAAADLAFQAGSDRELLEFLVRATHAVAVPGRPAAGGATTHYNQGNAHRAKGEFDRAIIEYTEAIRLDPRHASAYNSRGIAYRAKGDLDGAIADYTEAIRLDPKHVFAYNNRGNVYYGKRDFGKAIADYTEAIRLNPGYAIAYHNRGLVHQARDDYERAIADYTEAIRLDPKYVSAYSRRGVAYRAADERDRAIADFTEAIRLDPQYANAYVGRGNVHLDEGDLDRAVADFTDAIRINPKLALAYRGRGRAHFYSGDLTGARNDIRQAIELQPKHAYAALWLDIVERRSICRAALQSPYRASI